MKNLRPLTKFAILLVGLWVIAKGTFAFLDRPTALYKRWIGGVVPEDVWELDGCYSFAITESTAWLSFKTTEERIAAIVKGHGMHEVLPETPWSDGTDSRRYSIDGKRSGGNWFDIGL